ncbi:MAG: alpha amylase C-terminal domain-containing protein [Bacteroidales bacterium]|jgi:1,4-alpha-glucan branching enzyme|nr:alpha amylase C-terminal domain-containing protein [Bacteroidales bacterium]
METPLLVKNDPWLQSFENEIISRLEYTAVREQELCASEKNLVDFANGYLFFGCHKTQTEWIFREWAPNATNICLVGDFSSWEEQVNFVFEEKDNYWELRVPVDAIQHGQYYKLSLYWKGGHAYRIPAWARRVVQDEETKIFSAQIWDKKPYAWKHKSAQITAEAPLIYEAHVGMATEDARVGSYKEFTKNILPLIKKDGYNTVQLMAIQEHPYYGSFGYHVSSFFAPSSRFGTPEDLKELIDSAHAMGLRVIMDIVHSHAVKNEEEGLGRYDGTDFQFFHKGNKGNHDAWDSKCFDYGKNEVIHFLLSNCKYWLTEFDFDGFRFDGVTSMLYWDHGLGRAFTTVDKYFDGAQDGDAITYLMLANKLIHAVKPQAITIAEDMSGMPGLASPLEYGGYGFDYRLSMGVPDFWIKMIKDKCDEDWNVGSIFHELTQARFDEKVISYAESHDQALVGDKTIAFRLMDKDMYYFMHVAYPSLVIDRGMALHKIIRLITLACAPNGYLNFMGNEFGHPEWIDFPREGNGWSYQYARRQWNLKTDTELRYHFLNEFDNDMIALVKHTPAFFEKRAEFVHENIQDQILMFERGGLYFVFSFNPTHSFPDYGFFVPEGEYKVMLTVDSTKYGGLNRIDETMLYQTMAITEDARYTEYLLKLYVPSQTCIVLKRVE